MLERSATANVFKHTLSGIPTVFGRLFYLASLRDANTGFYEHHGLRTVFGREESRRALSESHLQVFQAWLILPMEEKAADLRSYLGTLEEPSATVLTVWTRTEIYRTYLPLSSRESEKALYLQEFEELIRILSCD